MMHLSLYAKNYAYFTVLQGVPTSLEWVENNVLILRSLRAKRAAFRKKCILLLKIAFSAFFVNCKIENGILSNFSPIDLCSNLFSKLIKIGEKLL